MGVYVCAVRIIRFAVAFAPFNVKWVSARCTKLQWISSAQIFPLLPFSSIGILRWTHSSQFSYYIIFLLLYVEKCVCNTTVRTVLIKNHNIFHTVLCISLTFYFYTFQKSDQHSSFNCVTSSDASSLICFPLIHRDNIRHGKILV